MLIEYLMSVNKRITKRLCLFKHGCDFGPDHLKETTMELNLNNVSKITVQSHDRGDYKVTNVTVTDSEGNDHTIRSFGTDNQPITIELEND